MILIQCTKSKRDECCPARDLYSESELFKKSAKYAEEKEETWKIISAKHGLVNPDREIEPYDEYGLNVRQAKRIATILSKPGLRIELLAGKEYADVLTPQLEAEGVEVIEPMRGLRYGERLQWLNRKISEEANSEL